MPSATPAWSTKCSTVRSQKIVRYLWAFARTPTTSSVNPFGGRNNLGRGAPARWMAAAPLSAQSAPQTAPSQTVSGAELYQQHCAQCHDNSAATRAPLRDTLQKMPATRILRTLDFGLMMGVAYPLTREERNAVANYLGTKGPEPGPPPAAFCSAERHPLAGEAAGAWNGWSPSPAF